MATLATATDAILAARAADGDQLAFGVLVRRHAPFLVAFATRLVGSRADADDCVQEALITAWKRLPELSDPAKVRAWLTTIVSRKATDRLRARRAADPLDDDAYPARDDPERSAVTASQMQALSRVLGELPDDLRVVWVLREVSGASYDEIAETTGDPPATVRGRLARARRIVMDRMEEWR
jgi:RNA polymerase sigma-70 factor, ECF subfamily